MEKHKQKKKSNKFTKTLIIVVILILGAVGGISLYKYQQNKNELNSIANLYFMGIDDNKQIGKTQTDIEYNLNCSHAIEYPLIGKDEIDAQIMDTIKNLEEDFIKKYKSDSTIETAKEAFNGIEYSQYIGYETFLAPENNMSLIFEEAQEKGESTILQKKIYTYNYNLDTSKKLESTDIFGKEDYKNTISNYVKKYLTENEDYKNKLNPDYENKISVAEGNLNNYAITNDKLLVYFNRGEILPEELDIIKIEIPYTEISDCVKFDTGKKTETPKANTGANNQEEVKGKYKDVSETVYAEVNVHIRQVDNVQSEIKGSLAKGDSITRTGVGDDGWSKVTYNNETAYISSAYLTTTKSEEPKEETVHVDAQRNIDSSKPMVALTFDDGPNPNSTPRILSTLDKYNAVGTFFDLGTNMASYPKVTKQEEAMGCEVSSHTYGHKNLNTLSSAEIQADMSKAENIFVNTLGHKPNAIRPPYGNANSTVKSTLKYPLINWDIDTEDWKTRNADSIIEEVHKYSNLDGRVILMHSIYGTTADAVERLVPELIQNGYQLVTVSELAKYKGVDLQAGKLYYDFR